MEKGDRLFVRIDSRVEETEFGDDDFDDHIDYVEKTASERYVVGGGFTNLLGGMIIFAAQDLEEAEQVAANDPLIKRNLYTYELYEWELAVVSDQEN